MEIETTVVQVDRHNNTQYVRLNRPDRLNAFNGQLHTELTNVLEGIAADPAAASTIVLCGVGQAFSAGGDLQWFKEMDEDDLETLFAEARRLIYALLAIEQPIIAMVRGPAVGLGATIALMSDFVIATEDAVFADPHVQIGVVAGDGGAAIWPLLCGIGRAKRYLLLGEQLDAKEAQGLGLIDWIVAGEDLEVRTEELATRLARGPQQAIRGTKKAVNKHLEDAVARTLDLSLALERPCFTEPDHREAVEAFLEKRRPIFGQYADSHELDSR